MSTETLDPQPDNHCFGCGGANPRGLKLRFTLDRDARRVTGHFRFPLDLAGSSGIVHGGITALVFDEAMGKLCRLENARAVTAELTVEYLAPIAAEQEIEVTAEPVSRSGRNLMQRAEIRAAGDGRLLGRARGRFVIISARA